MAAATAAATATANVAPASGQQPSRRCRRPALSSSSPPPNGRPAKRHPRHCSRLPRRSSPSPRQQQSLAAQKAVNDARVQPRRRCGTSTTSHDARWPSVRTSSRSSRPHRAAGARPTRKPPRCSARRRSCLTTSRPAAFRQGIAYQPAAGPGRGREQGRRHRLEPPSPRRSSSRPRPHSSCRRGAAAARRRPRERRRVDQQSRLHRLRPALHPVPSAAGRLRGRRDRQRAGHRSRTAKAAYDA